MNQVRIRDCWEYIGRRRRKALPLISIITIEQGRGDRALALYTYRHGRLGTVERRRWISIEHLQRFYRLAFRHERLV